MLSLWSVAVRPANTARRAMTGAAARCLLALSLALGATCVWAQTGGIPAAQDTSIDVRIGSSAYEFRLNDFAFKDANGNTANRNSFVVEVVTLPAHGILVKRNATVIRSNHTGSVFLPGDFGDQNLANPLWVPPFDAISVTPAYTSFTYRGYSFNDVDTDSLHGTITINLVGASSQLSPTGAPTVTGGTGTSYAVNTPLTASIYGVADRNGIDTSTLAWQWEQADIPSSGTSVVSEGDYSPIQGTATTGGLSSGFTPRAEHVGKYLRVCASFKDQHSTPKGEEQCGIGLPVEGTSSGSSLRLRLRLFLEGPLR